METQNIVHPQTETQSGWQEDLHGENELDHGANGGRAGVSSLGVRMFGYEVEG